MLIAIHTTQAIRAIQAIHTIHILDSKQATVPYTSYIYYTPYSL